MKKCYRMKFKDSYTAFQFRMPAGFPGDVNRTHPAEIEATLIDASAPPTLYGQFVLMDATTQGVRPYAAGDASDSVTSIPWGVTVRPFPTQQTTTGTAYGAIGFGAATPPVAGIIDVARNALIMGQLNVGVTAPVKGGRVYIWCAATSGNHIQGGIETAASSGNTVELDQRFVFNSPPDANGVVELSVNI